MKTSEILEGWTNLPQSLQLYIQRKREGSLKRQDQVVMSGEEEDHYEMDETGTGLVMLCKY